MSLLRGARRRAASVRKGPLLWSLAAAVLFVVGTLLDVWALWTGMLLAVPLVIFSSGLGWQVGAAMVPVAALIVFASDVAIGDVHGLDDYAGVAVVGALAVAAGQNLFSLWRGAQRGARSNERRAELLSQAANTLHQTETRQKLYDELTRLLSSILSVSHAAVLVPRDDHLELVATYQWDVELGYPLPLDSICGTALRTRQAVYVPDTQADPRYVAPPNSPVTLSEIAVPLLVAGEVVAVLNVEHRERNRFSDGERSALRGLVQIAEEALGRIRSVELLEHQRSEQEFLARFNHALLSAASTREVSRVVLRELLASLAIDGGAVFSLEGARFSVVADMGDIPADVRTRIRASGLPWGLGQIYQSWVTQEPIYISDYQSFADGAPQYRALGLRSVAFVPIVNAQGRTQALLEFGSFRRARTWSDRDRALLEIVASTLGVAFERAVLQDQMVELLDIVRSLAQTDDPSQLYQDAVDAAVRLIPGAEAASILVRSDEGFRFAALHGFDEGILQRARPFTEAAQLTWYSGSVENFRAGVPRLATGSDVRRHSEASRKDRGEDEIDALGRVPDLCANICVPITFGNEVIGILNIDNLTHEGAFGVGDLRLAASFGQQVGVIIRQTEYREALERSVVTDPLTGLGNREGFNRQLTAELSRAKRYGHPVNLLMMDLDGFKAINDRFGHQAGDEALIRVASTIRDQKREGDSAFRWGGDEFALVMPQVSHVDARRAAERFARSIEELAVDGFRLSASIGIANYPHDASDRDELLRIADDLMYQRKKLRSSGDPPEFHTPS